MNVTTLRLEATSPDGSITAKLSASGGLLVECRPRSLGYHSESSLEQQIQSVLDDIQARGHEALSSPVDFKTELRSADPVTVAAVRDRVLRYRRLMSEIDIVCTSPRLCAEVRVTGATTARIRIIPGAMDDHVERVIMSEVNEVLRQAFTQQAQHMNQIADAIVNHPPLASEAAVNGRD